MRYRNSYDIYSAILDAIRDAPEGAMYTRVMYSAAVSQPQLTGYLKTLKTKGLLTEFDLEGHRKFRLTAKGMEYIRAYQNLAVLVK